jgi:uncharacterized SAM-binding protein YcdF (DUF218 family)
MQIVARIVDLLLDPANLLGLLVVAAALLSLRARWRAAARRLTWLAALLVVACVLLPLDVWLLRPLEQRFPAAAPPPRVDGVIMLGGAQRPRATQAYGRAALNGHAERMTTFLQLARQYPGAKLVFSGGAGDPGRDTPPESDTVRLFLREQGFDDGRVLYESESRNTWENVVNTEKLLKPRQGEVWLVVASAADVPRTVGVFRRLGWAVTPVPVAYAVLPDPQWQPALALTPAFARIRYGLHEWAGLVSYYVLGRIEAFFPAP